MMMQDAPIEDADSLRRMRIRATRDALAYLHRAVLHPLFDEVRQIAGHWSAYPPRAELASTQRVRVDMHEYVERTLELIKEGRRR